MIFPAAAARRWTRGLLGTSSVPRMPPVVLLPTLIVLLVVSFVLSVGVGAVKLHPQQTLAIIGHHLGLNVGVSYTPQQDAIVWAIRLPRVVMAVLVGSALAVSGTALQGMFRNPLADPGLIGVSSGAALGAVTSVALGISALGVATLPVCAFIGGVVASVAVYLIARHEGR